LYCISEIVKLAKGENETQLSKMTQSEQDTYEMHVRAANIVSCIAMLVESASVSLIKHV
jgi:mediator of RNA polymerase II transcription subunit 22